MRNRRLSVADFYRRHVRSGRAPLRKGGFEPAMWIVRAVCRGRATYWLCSRENDSIELLDPTADVTTLRWRPSRPRRALAAA